MSAVFAPAWASPSNGGWRALVAVAAFASAIQLIAVGVAIDRSTGPGVTGSMLFGAGPGDRAIADRITRPVTRLWSDSPLAAAGGRIGDRIVYDHPGDGFRSPVVGEAIGLTLHRDGEPPRHLVLRAVPDPDVVADPVSDRVALVLDLVNHVVWLLTAMLIAWRRPERGATRLLTAVFVCASANSLNSVLPGGAFADYVQPWIDSGTFFVMSVGFLAFSLGYPAERRWWDRRGIRAPFYAFAALSFVTRFLWVPVARMDFVPGVLGPIGVSVLNRGLLLASTVAALVALFASWRVAVGAARRRMAWIAACMGVLSIAATVTYVWPVLGFDFDPTTFDLWWSIVQVVGTAGLAYGLLRHRLLDFGFALNRLAVYALLAVILVTLAFGGPGCRLGDARARGRDGAYRDRRRHGSRAARRVPVRARAGRARRAGRAVSALARECTGTRPRDRHGRSGSRPRGDPRALHGRAARVHDGRGRHDLQRFGARVPTHRGRCRRWMASPRRARSCADGPTDRAR